MKLGGTAPVLGNVTQRRLAAKMAQRWLSGVTVIVVAVALWQAVVSLAHVNSTILPSPLEIGTGMVSNAGLLWSNSLATLVEVLLGFAASIVIAVPLGVMIGSSRRVAGALFPLVLAIQTVPKVALAPLFVLWMGLGLESKVVMALTIGFFPILISTVSGLRSVPVEMHELVRVCHMGRWLALRQVEIPYAMPQMFAGFKVAITLAVIGALVSEFVAANVGLGYVILAAEGSFNTVLIFEGVIAVTVLGGLLYGLVVMSERLFIPWHVSQRSKGGG